jgi:hypothetical protein
MAIARRKPDPDGITTAQLASTAGRYVSRKALDVEAAVTELREIADGRGDLLRLKASRRALRTRRVSTAQSSGRDQLTMRAKASARTRCVWVRFLECPRDARTADPNYMTLVSTVGLHARITGPQQRPHQCRISRTAVGVRRDRGKPASRRVAGAVGPVTDAAPARPTAQRRNKQRCRSATPRPPGTQSA